MYEEVKDCAHHLARNNKAVRGLIFTDRDNKPIAEEDDAEYNPNDDPTLQDYVFELDDYVPGNFPARANDGNDTHENPNFGNANYYTPLKGEEEHQYNNDKEPPNDVEGTNNGDDDDNNNKNSKNTGAHEETSENV